MPPRPSICGVQAALSATPLTWRTTTTSAPAFVSRFSTTPPAAYTGPVPPESPNFIKLPEPKQSSEPRRPRVRGILPVPRQVFAKKEGSRPRKLQPDYVASIKPRSAAEQAGLPPATAHEARHRVLADARRKSLTEGLRGLWDRKSTEVQRLKDRSAAHAARNIAAAMSPERLDEVLTRSSIRASTANITTVAPDPARFEVAERAKIEHEAKLSTKSEARRDALSQLYMAAGNFIVDQAELEERVNVVFSDSAMTGGSSDAAESIWIGHGAPISTRAEIQSTFGVIIDPRRSDITRTTMRQKSVAEALTGGKL